jgi:predicted P-loop ATPase/GTPase
LADLSVPSVVREIANNVAGPWISSADIDRIVAGMRS